MPRSSGIRALRARVRQHLEVIYGVSRARRLVTPVVEAMRYEGKVITPEPFHNCWDETDCWVITYAGSIEDPDRHK